MRRAKMSIPITVLMLGLMLWLTGIARAAQVAELEKLNICYSSIAATSVTTWQKEVCHDP